MQSYSNLRHYRHSEDSAHESMMIRRCGCFPKDLIVLVKGSGKILTLHRYVSLTPIHTVDKELLMARKFPDEIHQQDNAHTFVHSDSRARAVQFMKRGTLRAVAYLPVDKKILKKKRRRYYFFHQFI